MRCRFSNISLELTHFCTSCGFSIQLEISYLAYGTCVRLLPLWHHGVYLRFHTNGELLCFFQFTKQEYTPGGEKSMVHGKTPSAVRLLCKFSSSWEYLRTYNRIRLCCFITLLELQTDCNSDLAPSSSTMLGWWEMLLVQPWDRNLHHLPLYFGIKSKSFRTKSGLFGSATRIAYWDPFHTRMERDSSQWSANSGRDTVYLTITLQFASGRTLPEQFGKCYISQIRFPVAEKYHP